MMLQYKRHRRKTTKVSSNNCSPRAKPCSSKTGQGEEMVHVRNFMQSVDPNAGRKQPFCPFSSSSTATVANETTNDVLVSTPASSIAASKRSPLPFFPDPSSFDDVKPGSFPSGFSVASVASSFSTSTMSTASSHAVHASSKSVLSSAKFPSPRKKLFSSTNRAQGRGLQQQARTFYDPQEYLNYPNENSDFSKVLPSKRTKKTKTSPKTHTITIDGENDKHERYRFDDLPPNPNGGIFEADAPEMGPRKKPPPVLPQVPPFSTPPKHRDARNSYIDRKASTNAALDFRMAMVSVPRPVHFHLLDNQWRQPTTTPDAGATSTQTTPKRVSLATGTLPDEGSAEGDTDTNAPTSCEELIISPPKLCSQPSVSTTMAASVLMSLMVTNGSPHCVPRNHHSIPHTQHENNIAFENQWNNKRSLDFGGIYDARFPKKHRISPRRISNFVEENLPSAENKENAVINALRHSISVVPATPNETFQPKSRTENRIEIGIRNINIGAIETRFCEKKGQKRPSPSSPTDSIASDTSNASFKRIPRRFMDDPTLPILKDGMRLAAPDDQGNLNSLHCFVRSELLEVFVLEDSKADAMGNVCTKANNGKHRMNVISDSRKKPFGPQRVGIRCVYCGTKPKWEGNRASMSTFFPKSLQDIYRGVCTWQRIHFKSCHHVPEHMKDLYVQLKNSDRSRGKKAHWVQSAYDMGFRNVDDNRNGVFWAGTTEMNKDTKLDHRRLSNDQASSVPSGIVTLDLTKGFEEGEDYEGEGYKF